MADGSHRILFAQHTEPARPQAKLNCEPHIVVHALAPEVGSSHRSIRQLSQNLTCECNASQWTFEITTARANSSVMGKVHEHATKYGLQEGLGVDFEPTRKLSSQAELLGPQKVLATSHGASRFPGLPGLSTFGNPLAHPSNALLESLPLPNFPRIEAIDYRIPRRSKTVRSPRWRQCTTLHGHACISLHYPGNACRCQGVPCCAATLAWADSL